MNDTIKNSAKEFVQRWHGKGYEKGESQQFWLDLLVNIYEVPDITGFITFEEQVKLDHTAFIDGYIESTHVMIEQKSLGKDLRKGIKQSDGTLLTPFQQAKRYALELPYSKRPRWIVTCNFSEFLVYDMEKPNCEPEQIFLKDLPKEYYRLQFLVDTGNDSIKKEMEISLKAGELVGKLYDLILKQYKNSDSLETLKSLNMLCVRLVFCLYAEDSGIFGKRKMFGKYLQRFPAMDVRKALIELFQVLDTPISDRDPYMNDDLSAFPYVNGGL
ncbi:MAG: methylase, partial [Ruminococcus sp.]|nr:methylase [Ruminococcus sp.]